MEKKIDFTMEELIPIVAKLTDRYTSKESSSVPYEIAVQLMEAVLYCIGQAEQDNEEENWMIGAGDDRTAEAQFLYDQGYDGVLQKVRAAKELYETILQDFDSYGNQGYADTIIKGLPAFFVHYDARFNPQDHILTLDYPTIRGIGELCGVAAIERYLTFIGLEQKFLQQLPENFVREVLSGSEDLFINICEPVLQNLLGSVIAGRRMDDPVFCREDLEAVSRFVSGCQSKELEIRLHRMIGILIDRFYSGNQELTGYLSGVAGDFCIRLINGVENHCLESVFSPAQWC